jgi:thioredoxin reductase
MFDAAIVGGSFAGLTAALQLVRARRSVAIFDTGLPRNRFAAHAHGVLGHDGKPPMQIRAEAEAQLRAYPGASFIGHGVDAITGGIGDFTLRADGTAYSARRILLTYGVTDILPPVQGLTACWGKTAIHCPYCHGYEFGGRRFGILMSSEMAAHLGILLGHWSDTITLFTNGHTLPSEEAEKLTARGVVMVDGPVSAVDHTDGVITSVVLADGRRVPCDALMVQSAVVPASPLAADLGCEFADAPMGPMLKVDAQFLTSVPGVYAAGDLARAMHNLTLSTADGLMAGIHAQQSLL